jgi:hypothetical protein
LPQLVVHALETFMQRVAVAPSVVNVSKPYCDLFATTHFRLNANFRQPPERFNSTLGE